MTTIFTLKKILLQKALERCFISLVNSPSHFLETSSSFTQSFSKFSDFFFKYFKYVKKHRQIILQILDFAFSILYFYLRKKNSSICRLPFEEILKNNSWKTWQPLYRCDIFANVNNSPHPFKDFCRHFRTKTDICGHWRT